MKKSNLPLLAALASVLLCLLSNKAFSVVTITLGSGVNTFDATHQGFDRFRFTDESILDNNTSGIGIDNYYTSISITSGDGVIGIGSGGIAYTSSSGLVVPISTANGSRFYEFFVIKVDNVPRSSTTTYLNGATLNDLNYTRWDLNSDGIFETVLEIFIGQSSGLFGAGNFTRYFYDENGSELTVERALNPNLVPEPSASVLFAFGFLSVLFRRSR